MHSTEIKNNEVFIEEIPYSEWGAREFHMWRENTQELLDQVNRMGEKLAVVAKVRFRIQ